MKHEKVFLDCSGKEFIFPFYWVGKWLHLMTEIVAVTFPFWQKLWWHIKDGRVLYLFIFCLFVFSRAIPAAYGGSQARSLIEATAAGLRQSHSNSGYKWCVQPTPKLTGNARSLPHWARPGIEPKTSQFLVGFVNHWATTGAPIYLNHVTQAANWEAGLRSF